jgi:glycosyltransferase involved in cell wall biosynthesis
MLKVAYSIPDDGGSTFYRVQSPMMACKRNSALLALPIFKNDDFSVSAQRMQEANIILASRVNNDSFLKVITALQKQGKKVIIDYDDDMFNVSPMNPAYQEQGVEEVSVYLEGEKIDVWKDGKNFSIKENVKRLDAIRRVCAAADMITVTTPHLADVYLEFNQNVRAMPNCVDLRVWRPSNVVKDGTIRIGWFGGSSHYEDWCLIAPVMKEILSQHANVRLVLLGVKFDGTLKGIDPKQIEWHDWVHTQAYPYKAQLLNLDFAVIPLVDNAFNRAKSSIKWVEMASMSVPAVTSFVPPYSELMDKVPNNGIFIDDNDQEAWFQGIRKLINDESLRKTIGENAAQTVAESFDINQEYGRWANAFKEVYSWHPRHPQPLAIS